jgi:hypothetical protein
MRPEQTAEALVERQTPAFKIRLRDKHTVARAKRGSRRLARRQNLGDRSLKTADFTRQALVTNFLNGTQRFQRNGFVVATARMHRKLATRLLLRAGLPAFDLQKLTNGAVVPPTHTTTRLAT